MRTPPLLADFIHARPCKPFCEKLLTLPLTLPDSLGSPRRYLKTGVASASRSHPFRFYRVLFCGPFKCFALIEGIGPVFPYDTERRLKAGFKNCRGSFIQFFLSSSAEPQNRPSSALKGPSIPALKAGTQAVHGLLPSQCPRCCSLRQSLTQPLTGGNDWPLRSEPRCSISALCILSQGPIR